MNIFLALAFFILISLLSLMWFRFFQSTKEQILLTANVRDQRNRSRKQ
jgi:hypothetical protein